MLILGTVAVIMFAAGVTFGRRQTRLALPFARTVNAPKALLQAKTRALPAAHGYEGCTYCRSADTARIDITDKVPVPDGVTDFGHGNHWVTGVYCDGCGRDGTRSRICGHDEVPPASPRTAYSPGSGIIF